MSSDQFEKQMLAHLRRDPFEPFIVRTDTDQLIVVDNPQAVAISGGGAGYIGPEQLHFIESKQVVEIRSLNTPASH